MEFTFHSKLRFIQRLMGVKEEKEAMEFLENHEYEVCYKFLELFNQSKLLYKNFSPNGDGTTYDYYIIQDFLIVTTVKADKIIILTLYDIRLDSDDTLNHQIVTQYIKNIRWNNKELNNINKAKEEQDKESRHLEFMIKETQKQLALLEKKHEESVNRSINLTSDLKELKKNNRNIMMKLMYGFKKISKELKVD